MTIIEVLEGKQVLLKDTDSVHFSGEELNVLCDPAQLRALKLQQRIPKDFSLSSNVEECVTRVRGGDSIYRVLEYCILKNRALSSVCNVFGQFRK